MHFIVNLIDHISQTSNLDIAFTPDLSGNGIAECDCQLM